MSRIAYTVDRFLEPINVEHGPPEIILRIIVKGVISAAQRGVYLEHATFDQFMQINGQNMVSWRPLSTSWRTDVGGVSEASGQVIFGRDDHGDVVATSSAKCLDWRATNFKREAESLRFFYADPERDKAPDESCTVTAASATAITGCVMHTGGAWHRPDMRGRQLARIIPRVGRACAMGRWPIDEVCGIISEANTRSGFDKRCGYPDITRWVTVYNSPSYPGKVVRLVLVRMHGAQIMDDATDFLLNFDAEIDAGVGQRRA